MEAAAHANRILLEFSPASNKFMFYARVLTGDYMQGPTMGLNTCSQGLKAPPPKDPSKSTSILYDSVVDNVKIPRMYVVFNNDQSYPDYLITYTSQF